MNGGPILRVSADLRRVSELDAGHRRLWAELQTGSGLLKDAFFSYDFAAAVANLKEDVRVAVLSKGTEVVGYLPFEQNGGVGTAVGSLVSEAHGAIVRPDAIWDAEHVIRQAGLSEWNFVCAPADQTPLRKWRFCEDDFPYVCLKDGIEGLRADMGQRGSRTLSQTYRKMRKLERERGSLRFEFQARDRDAVLECLMAWKSAHLLRIGVADPFAFPWIRKLARNLGAHASPSLTGVLSALYLGDELLAAHLGLKGFDTLNCWYPAYNPDPAFSGYSPGQILLVKMLEAANGNGIVRYHFGRGPEPYKARLRNGGYAIMEGSVNTKPLPRLVRKTSFQVREFADNSPILALPLRCIRRGKQIYALRQIET
ncbi:MAG: GNAT family N-acetyltransferase [Pseudomonadota bacterium]